MRFNGEGAAKALLQYLQHIDSKPQSVKEEKELSTGTYVVFTCSARVCAPCLTIKQDL